MIPAGRMGDPSEYGALGVYLATDDSYCLGLVISANGGIVV
jgi:NAD(P)-dependent dehydrogenase (short-subunit alcohol dehydrogenase family)